MADGKESREERESAGNPPCKSEPEALQYHVLGHCRSPESESFELFDCAQKKPSADGLQFGSGQRSCLEERRESLSKLNFSPIPGNKFRNIFIIMSKLLSQTLEWVFACRNYTKSVRVL